MSDIDEFLAKQKQTSDEVAHAETMVAKYKRNMPLIVARWDTTAESIQFNDLNEETVSEGMSIYQCSAEALWSGLYEPGIYDAITLWSDHHDARKIAKVIGSWENNRALSPIFLVKHGRHDLGLVADGKHRLTVSRAIGCAEMPFMVANASEGWVSRAIPKAVRILRS